MAKNKTPEELQAEIAELQAKLKESEETKQGLEKSQAEIAELQAKLKESEETKQGLEKKVSGLKESGAKDLTVPGTAKVGKVKYRFLNGYTKTRVPAGIECASNSGELIPSEEALKDEALMAHLVKIRYAGIEPVDKK